MPRKDGQSSKSRKKRRPMPSDRYLVRNRDPRPIWRREDAKAELPLWEAMLFYGNQDLAKTVNDLTYQGFGKAPFFPLHEMPRSEQIEYNVNSMQLEHARMRMEFEFLSMLKSGAVFATGYASH